MISNRVAEIDAERRAVLIGRVRVFVAVTIGYNVIEAVVALSAGAGAGSAALIGFGLDSIIEVTSAAAVAWQFTGTDPPARERIALRVTACSFFALAAYVSFDAVTSLVDRDPARTSAAGVVLAAVSVVVMPLLSYGQRRTGRELSSRSAVADSQQTLLCTYLSAVLLVGLACNSWFGWHWADPSAALVIALVAVREGQLAWRGDNCCAPAGVQNAAKIDERAGHAPDRCCPPAVQSGPEVVVTGSGGACACASTTGGRPGWNSKP